MKIETKLKKWGLAKWKKEFWRVFSEWVRKRDNGVCFTCGIKKDWKEQQAGHFKPASICPPKAYFFFKNVRCQCYRCNINLQGNQYEFGRRLGDNVVKEIEELIKDKTTYTAKDYNRLIEEYKEKIKCL